MNTEPLKIIEELLFETFIKGVNKPYSIDDLIRLNLKLAEGDSIAGQNAQELEYHVNRMISRWPKQYEPEVVSIEDRKELVRNIISFGTFYVPPMVPKLIPHGYLDTAIMSSARDCYLVFGSPGRFFRDQALWETVERKVSESDTSVHFIVGTLTRNEVEGPGFSEYVNVFEKGFLPKRAGNSELRNRVRFHVMQGTRPLLHYITIDRNAAIIENLHRLLDPYRAMMAICASSSDKVAYVQMLRQRAQFTTTLDWVRLAEDAQDFYSADGHGGPEQELRLLEERGYDRSLVDGLDIEDNSQVERFMSYVKEWVLTALERDLKESWSEKRKRYIREHPWAAEHERERSAQPVPAYEDLPLTEDEFPPDNR